LTFLFSKVMNMPEYKQPNKGLWSIKEIKELYVAEGHGKVTLNLITEDGSCYVLELKKLKMKISPLMGNRLKRKKRKKRKWWQW